jgi:KaiC/GvpD/RAD55 family RecA-like ATPase
MKELFNELADVLGKEIEQLASARREITLVSGERVGAFAGYTYYRFEIPEEILLRTTEQAVFTFGQKRDISVRCNIVAIENQFMTAALPQDFGPWLPETKCSWNYESEQRPIIDLLRKFSGTSPIPRLLFHPEESGNTHMVGFKPQVTPTTPPYQLVAVRQIFQNRITMVWGPMRSGKTHVLALAAANYLKSGKKVLFVSPSNDNVDRMVLQTVKFGTELGAETMRAAARVDLPSRSSFDAIRPYSFEQQVEDAKAEKRTAFQERVNLLQTYWKVKIKQILHEDFYERIQAKRDKLAELRKLIDSAAKEISRLNLVIYDLENATILDRMKKGFSKEDLEKAHQSLAEQNKIQKSAIANQQAISNEIIGLELNAPISAEEQKQLKEANKRIDELGGLEKVAQSVEEFTTVDEKAMLLSKLFIATSVTTALIDPVLRSQQYDLVIVDEAQRVNLPTLAALSTLAREKMVVAGDPFEVEPESIAPDERAQERLQRDIFLTVAQTTELHRLFEWSQKNPSWCLLMKSLFATTPKLSALTASILFDDKINVFVSPQARGKIYFFDTSDLHSGCKQYSGKKRILPYNDQHTKKTVECIKRALMEPGISAPDVGVILPFTGPTLHTKLQLRLHGIQNVEVGTPHSFCNRRKRAIIFDTTMAGVDYTMRSLDDKKSGEHKIARLFNTVLSCVDEDLYIIADLSHFKMFYKDRLFTRILLLLQAEADVQQPSFMNEAKRFDELDPGKRAELFSLFRREAPAPVPAAPVKEKTPEEEEDIELKVYMKISAKQREAKPEAPKRNVELDVFSAAQRVLGWRADVNFTSQFVGGDILFHHSFGTESALQKLPLDSCASEKDFRNVMEQWNLLIYEMSDKHRTDLSFFAGKGPEGRVRQDIRSLRAFYSSDVEAAIEDGKHKIAAEVGRIFQELLGKNQPGNPAEWTTAYLHFLTKLEAHLSWISEQIRR